MRFTASLVEAVDHLGRDVAARIEVHDRANHDVVRDFGVVRALGLGRDVHQDELELLGLGDVLDLALDVGVELRDQLRQPCSDLELELLLVELDLRGAELDLLREREPFVEPAV